MKLNQVCVQWFLIHCCLKVLNSLMFYSHYMLYSSHAQTFFLKLNCRFPLRGQHSSDRVFGSQLRLQLFNGSSFSFELDSTSLFICMGPVNLFWSLNYLWSVFSFDIGILCFYELVMVMVLEALLVSLQQVFLVSVQLCNVSMPHLWARLLEATASL